MADETREPQRYENQEPAPKSAEDGKPRRDPAAQSGRNQQRPGEWRDVLATDVMNRYYGQHIAIIHKRVVAAGSSYEEVLRQAEEAYPSEMPYIAYIPKPKKT